MKTLNEWYSLKQITQEQYYQLLNLVNSSQKYPLEELLLLAKLPPTDNLKPLSNTLNKDNLSKYKRAIASWDTYPAPQFDYVSIMVLVAMLIIIIRNWNEPIPPHYPNY